MRPVLLQVVVHGLPSNWSSFNDDTLLEKAVSRHPLPSEGPLYPSNLPGWVDAP
jgi:hypothetical protein